MAKANAQIEISASSSRLGSNLSSAYGKFMQFGSSVARGVGKAFKAIKFSPGETTKRALGNFGGDLMSRGLDSILSTAGDVRDFERNLTRLGIASGQNAGQLNGMRDSINKLSRDTAISREEILAATTNYVDLTGDVAGAKTAMTTFARVAQASGASMADVSGAAAALGDALQIKPEDLEATFSGLINQGKAGAVTLKDFAGELSALAPKVARFKGMMGREGAIQLGAAFQVARKGFGSASQAATGLEALMGALALNAKKFEASGVKIFDRHKDGTKTFRNLHDIVTSIGKSKLAKDPTLLNKAFGSKEAEAAFNQLNRLAPMYDQIVEAGHDTQVVNRDLATFMESDAGRLDKAFNDLKVAIAEAFTPERIKGFISAIETAGEKLEPIIKGVGIIADGLGGLSGIGKSIRGAFSEDVNTFGRGGETGTMGSLALLQNQQRAKGTGVRADAARRELANRAAFGSGVENILGGEVGDRVSPESKRRAALLAYGSAGPGAEGAASAGRRYLEAAGVSKEQALEVIGKSVTSAMDKSNAKLAEIMKQYGTPTVQVGDNQVARSVTKSTDARRSTH